MPYSVLFGTTLQSCLTKGFLHRPAGGRAPIRRIPARGLLVVNDDHASILHRYGDTVFQKFWGHEFDMLGSRDVIGYVTIGLGICGFLLVVH